MDISTLLADPQAIRPVRIISGQNSLIMVVKTAPLSASCPRCDKPSARVHSRYVRTVADLPWHGIAVKLELHTRRFRCQNSLCTKRIFCERLPKVVAHYGRKTVRLEEVFHLIGFFLGGEAGSRAATQLAMSTSPDTLLRRMRQAAVPVAATPRVLGVDDFAFRRGKRYGTILIDQESRRPVDLLPDREAGTLSAWLSAHPGIEIITRDRSRTYAAAINEGAPQAVQVADRFHLLQNIRETFEQLLLRVGRVRRRQTMAVQMKVQPSEEHDAHEQCLIRLLPHLRHLKPGSQAKRTAPRAQLPSPRKAAWLLLSTEEPKEEEIKVIENLLAQSPEVPQAQELAKGFAAMVRGRKEEALRTWLISALQSKLPEFISFANGVAEDIQAVKAALSCEWSQGRTEGQVNRLKTIKRAMYGRGKFDLLRRRVLTAA